MATAATTPMIAPDGTVADVPNEHVGDLVRQGGKIGIDLLSPDGKERATVPIDQAHDAIRKGAIYAPPMPKAKVEGVDNPLVSTVKDEAKAAVAHPGQAVAGALNEGTKLMRSVMPQNSTVDTGADASGKMKPNAVTSAYNKVAGVTDQPNTNPTAANQAGAHATDVTAAVANAPAAVKSVANLAKSTKTAVTGAFDVKSVQPGLQNGVKQVLSDVAKENGVPGPKTAGVRDAAKEVADGIMAKSKDLYAQIDKATEGEYTNINRALENLNQEMRVKMGVNKDADAAMKLRKIELEMSMQNAMDTAKANGVDPAVAEQARANFKKAQALYDVDAQIKKAMPYTQNPTAQQANIAALHKRLTGLMDEGRLAEAVGTPDRAKQMLAHTEAANNALTEIKSRAKTAKAVAKGAGIASAGYLVGDKLKSTLSGH